MWTWKDYHKAVHKARQEMLLQQLADQIIAQKRDITSLARRAGVHPSTIKKWLQGETKSAMTRTLTAVGKVMGGSLAWIWRR